MGMKQRLGLAQAIMERPQLLVLDEPTNGLDTDGVAMFYALVKRLREAGVTILMASHIQEDIAALCDTVYHIERGRLSAGEAEHRQAADPTTDNNKSAR
jgi:ABC-2 type transport system ATP-binding protein